MQKLTLSILKDFTNDIILLGENVTKTNLKGLARANQYVVDSSFKDLFNQLGLEHTGKYTVDNHKIWTLVPKGKHLSKTKGSTIEINSMVKPYLRNAICKHMDNNPDMHDILTRPETEIYKMFKAFFTYEIRKVLIED